MISVAIDGPSGAGKSSLAKRLAKDLGYVYVDTGAMYRSIGLYAVRAGVDPKDEAAVTALLPQIKLAIRLVDGAQHIYLNGEDVSDAIRAENIGMAASAVSAHPPVRAFLLDTQRGLAADQNILMDGRDIGTVVLPNATVKIFLTASAEARAERRRKELEEKGSLEKKTEMKRETAESILAETDLSKSMSKEVYEERLKALQKKMEHLHGELYRRRIPVVLGFEGWDAGGKGGAIKRLTSHMDPRGYVVNPTASPSDTEKAHHYLWRFWRAMPKAGHIAIFDRTWYGRVMVERIEGFCTEKEWKRAYGEINAMEQDLVNAGAIVLKFWMQIDKDEQARRFKARQENPKKQWKITDEDWRNREKWDQYEVAVEEMLEKTSMPHAPWIVVEGNDKYYARIKVLECVTEAIEKRLKEERK